MLRTGNVQSACGYWAFVIKEQSRIYKVRHKLKLAIPFDKLQVAWTPDVFGVSLSHGLRLVGIFAHQRA